jgi:hypothetical protein
MDNALVISDDMFLGAHDADGSFVISIDSYLRRNGSMPFNVRVSYDFCQSNSKRDLVEKMADKFGVKTSADEADTAFRVGSTTKEGGEIRQFFLKNKPIYPGHLRDFLITEEILALKSRKVQCTKQGLITLIILAYNNYHNFKTNKRKYTLDFWINSVNASPVELIAGKSEAAQALARVEKEVNLLKTSLPTKVLTKDYIRGAHVGDGGLTVALTWKPSKADRLRTEPEWTISGEDRSYCQAFVNTLGMGNINLSSPNCKKFRLTGIKNCIKALTIFDDTWLPAYKTTQLAKFKEALRILEAKEHFTEQGIITLVSLVCDMSEKGAREHSKEQYIEWGLAWLRRHGYITS